MFVAHTGKYLPGKFVFSILTRCFSDSRRIFERSALTAPSSEVNHAQGEDLGCVPLKDYLLRLSTVSPESVRKFYRVSSLTPRDVLEILHACESIHGTKVESLWGIYKWATEKNPEFIHLPLSRKIMGSILARSGFYQEAETLLSGIESQGVLLDCRDVFSDLIEGYLSEYELDKAVSVYEKMRGIKLVPRISCYWSLLEHLVELNETQVVYNVYNDLIHLGIEMSFETKERGIHESAIQLLCLRGNVQEARVLVRNAMKYGLRPSQVVVNSITCGYCDKKDYYDLLSFYDEARISPDVVLGNKILFSLCQNLGSDQADIFLQKLEDFGFCPDEISLGILVSFSCREGNLKKALFYISDILARGLKPHLLSYNALLRGMFKEGMWMHTQHVLAEMHDAGVAPDSSTFIVMLAGLCRARRFDEVKTMVQEMSQMKLIEMSPLEDPLTKAFMLLGLNPLNVKIKRDNDKASFRTEFFDSLGNGLYLETNLDEFERTISQVLDDGILPKFDSRVIDECDSQGVNNVVEFVEEMVRWGQEMSLSAYSSLFNFLCRNKFSISVINHYMVTMSKPIFDLPGTTLSRLVQRYSSEGLTLKSRILVDGMVQRCCMIDNDTFFVLLSDTCGKGDLKSFQYYMKFAQKYNWSLEVEKVNIIISLMCQKKWFKEALGLFGGLIFVDHPDLLESLSSELSCQGFTSTASFWMQKCPSLAAEIPHLEAYNSFLIGFCHERKFSSAFRILEHMLCLGLSPCADAATQLVYHLCRTKNFEKAIELKNVVTRDQSSSALDLQCALIKGFCKYGNVEEAARMLQQTLLMKPLPDHSVFNALIVGYSGLNNFRRVKETLGFMIPKNVAISVSSYSHLIRLISAKGNISLCLSLKQLMLQVTDLPDIVLYNILIFHISSTRNRFLLDSVLDSFLKKGLQFDVSTYNFLIRGFSLCGDLSSSLKCLRTMLRLDLSPSNRSLRVVIAGLCCNEEFEMALNLSQEMESRGWVHGSVTRTHIGLALIKKCMFRKAVEFLGHMSTNQLIKYDPLIKQMCSLGKLDEAIDLLNIMLKKESSPESSSYDFIIQGLDRGHKLDMAMDFHAEMLCRELMPSLITWQSLMHSLVESNRVDEAEKLLRSMIQLGESPPRHVFCQVMNKYRSLHNNSTAVSRVLKLMQQAGHTPDFDTHWSIVSNLSSSSKKVDKDCSGFLSRLVSGFGFSTKK